jgi:sugar phosphate isomerase/epimerase
VWGTGLLNLRAVLEEMRRQGFQGVFSVEYEHNWDNSLPDIALCVANFEEVCKSILELERKQ